MTPSSASFDGIAAVYDASRGGEDRGRRFAAVLASHLDASRPVLEIGIGTGLVALGLIERGYAVAGIDLSVPMLRRALTRVGSVVACADATALPVAAASIEQACSVWVLHLVPARPVMAEVGRVLRPGGRYLVISSGSPGSERDDAGAILAGLMRTLDADWYEGRLDGAAALAALAPETGLIFDGAITIDDPYTHSPADIAERIEARAYSRLVDLPPDRWRAVVDPALAALRSLPDPQRPRRQVARHDVIVLRAPR